MIHFRRLYQRIEHEGVQVDALVAYGKIPHLAKTRPETSFNADWSEVPQQVQYTAQYRKYLYLDLWLCVIRHSWLTKEQD
jgi:hypothetical protein